MVGAYDLNKQELRKQAMFACNGADMKQKTWIQSQTSEYWHENGSRVLHS